MAGGSPWLADQARCAAAPAAACRDGRVDEDSALQSVLCCDSREEARRAGAQQAGGKNLPAYLGAGGGVRATKRLKP